MEVVHETKTVTKMSRYVSQLIRTTLKRKEWTKNMIKNMHQNKKGCENCGYFEDLRINNSFTLGCDLQHCRFLHITLEQKGIETCVFLHWELEISSFQTSPPCFYNSIRKLWNFAVNIRSWGSSFENCGVQASWLKFQNKSKFLLHQSLTKMDWEPKNQRQIVKMGCCLGQKLPESLGPCLLENEKHLSYSMCRVFGTEFKSHQSKNALRRRKKHCHCGL